MRLHLRVLFSRLRRTGTLTLLRLTGLTLAALLAAAVPAFVTTAMERVLTQELKALEDPLTVVVGWRAPDDQDYGADVDRLEAYLNGSFIKAAGFGAVPAARLTATAQRPVQRQNANGSLDAARRYLKLGPLPEGFSLSSGRLPAAGQPEVVIIDGLASAAGYQVGQQLRFPLTVDGRGQAVTVTVVGTVRPAAAAPLKHLGGAMESALLTSDAFWRSVGLPPGDVTWSFDPPAAQMHAAGVADLVSALEQLPLRAAQYLPDMDVIDTPLVWLGDFLRRMDTTQRFLLVLLTPVFLLVVGFAVATAAAVVGGRRTEIAVLRSRGATPPRVMGYYLSESVLLALVATGLGLLLTTPTVRLMGLTAGFLQLVGRPPLPVKISAETVAYALAAALLAELAALWPLARATRYTVATIRQEEPVSNALLAVARVALELALLGTLAYGTWRLAREGAGSDSLFLALPALALAGAGALALRLFALLIALFDQVIRNRLRPSLYLALSLLRRQSGRYSGLWLMLVITAGLGVYGAAFARTLDRDLAAATRYRLGADVVLKTVWESEVLSVDETGEVTASLFHEPPYDEMKDLPGAVATARVQFRQGATLLSGNRNLGKTTLMGITPDEFGRVGRFLSELTPAEPVRYLNLLAQDERAVVLSTSLAKRINAKLGDLLTVRLGESQTTVSVVATVPYWPGRLPEDGDFLVVNLHYLQDTLGLAPYDVWVRMSPGTPVLPLVEALGQRGVRLTSVEDAGGAVAAGRREPFRLGIYGTLSAGFLVAVLVMGLTYLLSVGLTLQSRAKELGVLRAMGMPRGSVGTSLYVEQLVLVGTALATGLPAGALAAAVYVPVLRLQAGGSVLPLRVAAVSADRSFLIIGSAVALFLGAVTVWVWLRRLSVNVALRLGEDG